MWDSRFWNKYFCWNWWSCFHLKKCRCIWNSSVSNIFLFCSISLKIISIFLMLFLSVSLSIVDESSLPNWTIWVHWWSSWVVVATSINMWDSLIVLCICSWCFHLDKSWGVWNSSVSNIFLFGSISLKVVSFSLMLFLSMDLTIMDSGSLPN